VRIRVADVDRLGPVCGSGRASCDPRTGARAVTLPGDASATAQAPARSCAGSSRWRARHARLYVTSLGLHEAFINGQRVGDALAS
jgi:hypothetical protein